MDNSFDISVIGGDTRLIYTAKRLAALGHRVKICGFELLDSFEDVKKSACDINEALKNDIIILGLPCSKNSETLYAPFCDKAVLLDDVAKSSSPSRVIFAGMLSGEASEKLSKGGARVADYYKNEALLLYNAMLTAEALTGILITKLPRSLSGARIAVTGYGRIGFYLVRMLSSLGARVTVFSRSALSLARARTLGIEAEELKDFCKKDRSFSAAVNTAPAGVLAETELKSLNRDCLLIEAASAPYGIDAEAAKKLGFTVFSAPSLPGKYSPESAGGFIADVVNESLREVKNSG